MSARSPGAAGRVVTFRRRGIGYALPITRVRRVVRMPQVKPLPGAPHFVVGTARVKDRLEVLVDPAEMFGGESAGPATRAVLVSCGGRDWGFLADSVGDVLDVTDADLAAAPPFLGGKRASGLRAVIMRAEEEILLLDPDALLSEAERATLPAAGASAPAD
jgi:purine-binding chemotaxis protein CheW